MTPPIVSSTFDIAHWFFQRGELDRIFVSPLKLQRLLYLAQSRYAGQHDGAPLMPSVFVVSEVGPLEPNLYRAIEHEPPKVSVHDLPEKIMAFVESIWRTYGSREIEALNREAMRDTAFKEAERVSGLAAIIDLDAMCRHYTPSKKPYRSTRFLTNCPTIFRILLPISSLPRAMRRATSVPMGTLTKTPRRTAVKSPPPHGFLALRRELADHEHVVARRFAADLMRWQCQSRHPLGAERVF